MKPSCTFAFIAAACAACISLPASAQSLRCKNDVASPGDSKASVLLKCGEPVVKDAFCKSAAPEVATGTGRGGTTVNVVPCTNIDEWTYKPGYGQLVTTLQFEEGVLKAIRYGDRIK